MSNSSMTTLLLPLAIFAGVHVVVDGAIATMQDPQESPSVPASIPYLGHIIGIIRSKFSFYVQLRYLHPWGFAFRSWPWNDCSCLC